MPDLRSWARDGRLIVVLAAGTRAEAISDLEGLPAVDFLLQHPSALERFARFSDPAWAPATLPSVQEAESSEEALLRWKRSVASDVVVPMLGRLIGRGLVRRQGLTLTLTPTGADAATQLAEGMGADRRDRVKLVTAEFRADPEQARRRSLNALSEGRS